MKRIACLSAVGAVLALAFAVISLQSDGHHAQAAPAAATTVQVQLQEYSVTASPSSVPAGDVEFIAYNMGSMSHELVIIKTDLAPDALPVVGNTVDETAASLQVIDQIAPFAPGTQQTKTVNLVAGNYVLICNLPGHYQAGIRTAFTVTEATATPTPTMTATATPTVGATETPTPTETATATPTMTSTPASTATPTPAATATPTPAATATPTPAATATPTPAATAAPTPAATAAPTPAATVTPSFTVAPATATPGGLPSAGAGGLGGGSGLPTGAWAAIGGGALLALAAAGLLLARRWPTGG